MMYGAVAYAFVIEEAVARPDEPLAFTRRLALGLGLALFVGVTALTIRRATGRLLRPRILLLTGTVVAVMVWVVAPWVSLTVAFVGVVLIALLEQVESNSKSAKAL